MLFFEKKFPNVAVNQKKNNLLSPHAHMCTQVLQYFLWGLIICTELKWQAKTLSPALHLVEIDLSQFGTVQVSVCMLARAYVCLYAYVQWWCIVPPSWSIWQVTAIRPTSRYERLCIARGKSYKSVVEPSRRRVHPKVPTLIIFRHICIPARRAGFWLCAVAGWFCWAAICPFWEILMNSSPPRVLFLFLLFSSSFHTLTGCPVV